MRIIPITSPLPGEHLAATSPRMQPDTETASWRLRLNFWAGRSLTADALELEQNHRGARLAWRGRAATPGIVRGLDVALESPPSPQEELTPEGHFVHLLPGHGFLAGGEDIVVARPLRIALDRIPVEYVRAGRDNHQPPFEGPPDGTSAAASIDTGDRIVLVDRFADGHVPWAAVLVVCPAEFRTARGADPHDPCELDPSQDPFADERRVDASIVRLCELPAAWRTLPLLGDDGDPRWRNRLAHVIFSEEARESARQQIQWLESQPEDRRWSTTLRPAELLPWEWLGVPVALLGSERLDAESQRTFFLDRAAVARTGGAARPRTRPALRLALDGDDPATPPPGAGTPMNWRARIDQFAAHLSLFAAADESAISTVASRFQFVPPAGFLPRGAIDFLTSQQALALPPVPGQPPDRTGISQFFPQAFAVDAVPVAVEDLDAALATSAPLAPYDFEAEQGEPVRVLVPVPQRVFDPQLLVVEQEDPLFAATVDRFVAVRQGWRQRRDFVRARRDVLQALSDGPQPPAPAVALEPGQFEPEPVESADDLGFTGALVSPISTPGPWEIAVPVSAELGRSSDDALFVWVRTDEDSAPSRIDARWTVDSTELRYSWPNPFPVPAERRDEDGSALPSPLWVQLTVPPIELGAPSGAITRFTLHLEDGRIALASVGQTIHNSDGTFDESFWQVNSEVTPEFTGGEWTRISDERLAAPFEDVYEPVFPDGRTTAQRVEEVETALNPPVATARPVPLSVAADGLVRVLSELDAEASEADDFVDAHFTRAQINLYRIRKLMLGQTAAQKLLVNPAISSIAEQQTAAASADQLQSFVAAAKLRKVTASAVTSALQDATKARAAGAFTFGGISAFVSVNPAIAASTSFSATTTSAVAAAAAAQAAAAAPSSSVQQVVAARQTAQIDLRAFALRDVVGERPETGPTLPPRGLSIGQRFSEPPATQNLSYARSDLSALLQQITALRLPLVGETVKSLKGEDVLLLALQGRVVPPPPTGGVTPTSESIRQAAVTTLLTFATVAGDTDEAEVTLAALDFTEIKSAILRTIERIVAQRRSIVQKGLEAIGLINEQGDAAAGRVLAIEGKLAETRHDVSVARALRQEEQKRVDGINVERDRVVHDEVKFLAYTRPRTVDLVRRQLPYWQLDLFGTPAAVPACLQRHDEPPAPLNAYIELFGNAPARWFTAIEPLLLRLDTPNKLIALIETSKASAVAFKSTNPALSVRTSSAAVQSTVLGAYQMISAMRQRTAIVEVADPRGRRWQDFQRDAREHATVGDLIAGRFGARDVSSAASGELEQIGEVATCLHAEFSVIAPAVRLLWIERFSQFDQPALLRDLGVLPQYGKLDRATRRRLQSFADWLFGRVTSAEADAANLINDLVRLCLLLASHAPVNQIIAGHVPRPTPVRPGLQIPIKPLNPDLVRVGMQFQVWQASRVVAHGLVEDLVQGEVTARVKHVEAQTTTIEPSMRIQFVPAALKLIR